MAGAPEAKPPLLLPPESFPAFPFSPPYGIQVDFMRALYAVCEAGGLGLMESPTGTGKTLSIICSALQWLEDHNERLRAQAEQARAEQAKEEEDEPDWLRAASGQGASTSSAQPEQSRAAQARARRSKKPAVPRHGVQDLLGGDASHAGGSVATAGSARGGPGAGGGSSSKPGSSGSSQSDPELDQWALLDGEPGAVGSRRRRPLGAAGGGGSSSDEEEEEEGPGEAADTRPSKTQVIFCSRTHSQLSQFVSELRRTPLASRMAVVALASRKVTCINEEVRRLGAAALMNERCLDLQQEKGSKAKAKLQAVPGPSVGPTARIARRKAATGGCPHLVQKGQDFEDWVDDVLAEPLDVEELTRRGTARGVCPYYGARTLLKKADVVLAPYSAVLSPEARSALGLHLEGAVLVVDEAHNLLDAVHATHSHSLTLGQAKAAGAMLSTYFARMRSRLSPRNAQRVQLLQRLLAALQAAMQLKAGGLGQGQGAGGGSAAAAIAGKENYRPGGSYSEGGAQGTTTGQGSTQAAKATMYHQKEGSALGTQAAAGGAGGEAGGQQAGGRAMTVNEFLFEHALDHINFFELLQWVKDSRLLVKLAGYTQWQEAQGEAVGTSSVAAAAGGRGDRLGSLHACISFFSAMNNRDSDGRVIVCQGGEGARTGASTSTSAAPAGPAAGAAAAAAEASQPSIKFVLLNAGAHFAEVISSCRAVVLASGTLAPVSGLVAQLLPSMQGVAPSSSHSPAGLKAKAGLGIGTGSGSGANQQQQQEQQQEAEPWEELVRATQAKLLGTLAAAPAQPTQGPRPPAAAAAAALTEGRLSGGDAGRSSGGASAPGLSASASPSPWWAARTPGPATSQAGCSCLAPGVASSSAAGTLATSGTGIIAQPSTATPRPVLHFRCGHVVPKESLLAVVLGKGPTGRALELRHAQRSEAGLMDELGRALLNMCGVVPGGVVAFAPSFAYAAALMARWTSTGLLASLSARKAVFHEPRNAAEVEAVLTAYSAAVAAGQSGGTGTGAGAGAGGGSQQTGALLLAVVGGKLSEGINFGDALGRCVVVMGMPFANPSDPELQERMAYLDARAQQGGGTLTGRQLYENMCMNAVNQCIGRVIRHRGDYAAVVLADARFLAPGPSSRLQQQGPAEANTPISKLPGWMQASCALQSSDFPFVFSSLAKFFKARKTVSG